MKAVGHRYDPAFEPDTVRATHRWTAVAALAGAIAIAAVIALNVGAVPQLPATIVLAVSVPVFFGAAIAAIPPARARRSGRAPRRDDAIPTAHADEVQRPSEHELVRAWRTARLAELGVPEEVALVLAEDVSFSHQELKRLLVRGCPLGTALRILQPD